MLTGGPGPHQLICLVDQPLVSLGQARQGTKHVAQVLFDIMQQLTMNLTQLSQLIPA